MAIDENREFKPINIALLTVSDTRGPDEDTSGDILAERIQGAGHTLAARAIEKDDADAIARRFTAWIDDPAIDAIVSTGGTGLTGRDVTPEATLAVIDRQVPGLAELMRMEGLKNTPRAVLSRAVSGICGATLIINLPGSVKGVRECLGAVRPVLGHAVETLKQSSLGCGE